MTGTVLNLRYELMQELDVSPLATLYRAKDRMAAKEVFVRVPPTVLAGLPDFRARAQEVVSRTSEIQSAAVERYIDLDEHEGQPFIITEGGPGQLLSERIKRLAPFSAPVCLQLMIGLLEGLVAIHGAEQCHGDVRPRNILVTPDGKIKLLGTGLWSVYSSTTALAAEMLSEMAPYLAPEISSGQMPSPSSDIYSAGCVFYELLIGKTPYSADTSLAMAAKHATAPPPQMRALNPSIPSAIEDVVKRALSKDPRDRFASAGDMLSACRMIYDAVRFGKAVTAAPEPANQPVAPRMSAIREQEPEAKPTKKKERELSDSIPRWLAFLFYLSVCAVVILASGFVYWNLTKPKTVKVPNLIGQAAADGQETLRKLGLRMTTIRRIYDERQPENTILKTDPASGREMRQGTGVGVVLSAGSKFVELPDLRGRTVADARDLLERMNLRLDGAIRSQPDDNIPNGNIIKQVPEPRKKVERMTTVQVITSSGAQGEDSASTDAEIRTTYELEVDVKTPKAAVLVRIDMTDARGTSVVQEMRRKKGDRFKINATGYGTKATFRIFYDGELVKQQFVDANENTNDAAAQE